MTRDLFSTGDSREAIAPGAVLLRGFAEATSVALLASVEVVAATSPFRHMMTPGGRTMSVAMTNCGQLGWVTDRRGYRYEAIDPLSGVPWPAMPGPLERLAERAAAEAGFADFRPNACLINRYAPDARLTLHRDEDEGDFSAPIVSVSLGLPAKFLFGGLERSDRVRRIVLQHGDVVVWGGPSRLAYHGIDALKPGNHPATGECRINLTFRRARPDPMGRG